MLLATLLGASLSPQHWRHARCCGGRCGLSDPWTVLGIGSESTTAEVRRAFRSRARQLHPDVCKDENAAERFQLLVEALELVQEGFDASRLRAPSYETPAGMTSHERAEWLIQHNHVICFIRGTKQRPRDRQSDHMVVMLSTCAFDTNTRFAAVDIAADTELGEAVLRRAETAACQTLPLCYIDGELIGGSEALDVLHRSGELTVKFGGEQLVDPRELVWRDEAACGEPMGDDGAPMRTPLSPREFAATYERDRVRAPPPRTDAPTPRSRAVQRPTRTPTVSIVGARCAHADGRAARASVGTVLRLGRAAVDDVRHTPRPGRTRHHRWAHTITRPPRPVGRLISHLSQAHNINLSFSYRHRYSYG